MVVEAAGGVCPVGIGLPQIASSVRAGISRIAESPIRDRRLQPIRMGMLPAEALEPLDAEIPPGLSDRRRRLLRLAAPVFRQLDKAYAASGGLARAPLFLGLPEPLPGDRAPNDGRFLESLGVQSHVVFNVAESRIFPNGRAAALIALDAALTALEQRRTDVALVGGVDSYVDLGLLARLDAEGRLRTLGGHDGFIPGEGCGMLVLRACRNRSLPQDRVVVRGVALTRESGHLYAQEPCRGEGLALAMNALSDRIGAVAPARGVYAAFNGEHFWAKEWGVAHARASQLFDQTAELRHPADRFGDAGAGLGALLLCLAHHDLSTGARVGPALVFASSDLANRGCAYLAPS